MAACGLAWVGTSPTPALTPDSIQYLSAARNIASGHGITTTVTPLESGEIASPFADWPPLYPVLLSMGTARADSAADAPLQWARWLNLVALVLAFVPLAYLAWVLGGPGGVVPVLAFFAVFRPVQEVTSFVWSEDTFVLFTYLSFALLLAGMHGRSRPARETGLFILAGLAAGLACGTRYLGVAAVAAGACTIILRTNSADGVRTLRRLVSFTVPASLPLLVWGARNWARVGHLLGPARGSSSVRPEMALLATMRTIAVDWITPRIFARGPASWLAFALGAGAFLWLAFLILRRYGPRTLEDSAPRLTGACLLVGFVVCYVLALILIAARVPFDEINTRLVAPAYPAMLLMGAGLLRGAARESSRSERRALAAAVFCLLTLQTAASARYARAPRETRDLSWPYWRTVNLERPEALGQRALSYLRELPAGTLVVSNVWDTVALRTSLPVKPLPGRSDSGFPDRLLSHPGAYVLVQSGVREERIGVAEMEDLASAGQVERIARWEGSHVYRIGHGR